MNYWTDLSIQYANQMAYLDDLFHIYPTIPEGIREIDDARLKRLEEAVEGRNNVALITELLTYELFPIKDSYVMQ